MRAVVTLATLLLAGCSTLLGIQDPSPPHDGGPDGDIDADDGGSVEHLTFSLGDFQIAQGQFARLHVRLVHADRSSEDVTATATVRADNAAIATVPMPGQINSGSVGTTALRATLASALPATINVTVTAGPCQPVINEFATGSGQSPADEWVELYSPCTDLMSVDGWTLVYRAATAVTGPDSQLMTTLTGMMAPGELRLYAGIDYAGANDGKWMSPSGILQQNSGAIGLRRGPQDTGPLVDSVGYGAVTAGHPFVEVNAAGMMANGRAAARMPFDGRDGDNGAADFVVSMTMTPHALNAP